VDGELRGRGDPVPAKPECGTARVVKEGRSYGTSWQFTVAGLVVRPDTIQAAIDEAVAEAFSAAADAMATATLPDCQLPCTPVLTVDIQAPTIAPGTGTQPGPSATGTISKEGPGLEISTGDIWTNVSAYVVWTVYQVCVDEALGGPALPGAGGETAGSPGPGIPASSGTGPTIIVKGKPVKVVCPSYSRSGQGQGYAFGFIKHSEPGTRDAVYARVREEARQKAMADARQDALAAIAELGPCGGRCPTDQLSVTYGPFKFFPNAWNHKYTTEVRMECWVTWTANRVCS
jgi:hypothetical protein